MQNFSVFLFQITDKFVKFVLIRCRKKNNPLNQLNPLLWSKRRYLSVPPCKVKIRLFK